MPRIQYDPGRIFEYNFFGYYKDSSIAPKFISWQSAVKFVIANQHVYPWDPSVPSTSISRRLFGEVRKRIKSEFQHELKLYCALGTALDWWHHIDCFFLLGPYIVTMDITTDQDKKQVGETLVIRREDVWPSQEEISKRIAQLFNEQIEKDLQMGKNTQEILRSVSCI
jgi:hypothetical protein